MTAPAPSPGSPESPQGGLPVRTKRRGMLGFYVATGVLALLFSCFAFAWYYVWPVLVLSRGLDSYLAPPHSEPIDDHDNMARMDWAVLTIRERRLHGAAPVLLNVWMHYDATDNHVGSKARQTLVSFGEAALPAIEARLDKERPGRKYDGTVDRLERLRLEVLKASPHLRRDLAAEEARE